jgi:hypothetical protein
MSACFILQHNLSIEYFLPQHAVGLLPARLQATLRDLAAGNTHYQQVCALVFGYGHICWFVVAANLHARICGDLLDITLPACHAAPP